MVSSTWRQYLLNRKNDVNEALLWENSDAQSEYAFIFWKDHFQNCPLLIHFYCKLFSITKECLEFINLEKNATQILGKIFERNMCTIRRAHINIFNLWTWCFAFCGIMPNATGICPVVRVFYTRNNSIKWTRHKSESSTSVGYITTTKFQLLDSFFESSYEQITMLFFEWWCKMWMHFLFCLFHRMFEARNFNSKIHKNTKSL